MKTGSVDSILNRQAVNNGDLQNRGLQKTNKDSQPDSLQINKQSKLSGKELREKVKNAVEEMNDIVETVKEGLAFKIHDKTETLMVQVVDIKTKDVIKELPPEEMLDLSARIHKMVGLLIDEKV